MRPQGGRVSLLFVFLLATPALALGQTVTAAWDPSPADDAVLSYEICVSTTSLSCNVLTATVPASQTTYTFSPRPGILHRVAVRAVSAAAAGEYSPEIVVSIPAVSPIANLSNTVNAPVPILAITAVDPDGGRLTFAHTGLPFGLSLDSTTGVVSGTPSATGIYNVTILVNDGIATSSTSFVWTILGGSSDAQAPSLSIATPTSGQTVTSTSVTIAGSATDAGTGDNGIAMVLVNGVTAAGGSTTGGGMANWSRTLTLPGGPNVVSVLATDGAGNATRSQITINVVLPDTAAPSLAITSHSSGQLVNRSSIILSGTATDNGTGANGIASVTVNGAVASGTALGNGIANWSSNVGLALGPNALTVVATDAAGNARQIAITINSDPAPPALGITSYTSGQTVTTSSITLSGTASDGATGGTGISSVLVNGAAATGGTATGGGTANWSRTVNLNMGANTITVEARDGASNVATSTLTINRVIAPITSVILTGNLPSPQLTNTTIAFTATGAGGVAPRQYKFLVQQGGSAAVVAQNWSTTATYTWTPSVPANYTVTVWARSAGVTADVPDASGQVTYDIVTPDVQAISATPSSGSGGAQMFSFQFSDSRGAGALNQEWVWFSGNPGHCMAYYERPSNTVYLLNDDTTGWYARTLGSGTLQNSYCSIALGISSVSTSGNVLTLNLALTFSPAFSGAKTTRMFANAAGTASSGWQDRGTWTVSGQSPSTPSLAPAVSAVSVSPNAGSGSSQLFSMQFSDSRGAASLATEWVWFAPGYCLAYHDRAANTVSLINDAGTDWMTRTLGSGTLQNSSCSINLSGSSASMSGTTLTLNLAVAFSPSYAGSKTISMFANAAGYLSSGWQDRGSWTVPTVSTPAPPPPSVPSGVSVIGVTPGSGSGRSQTFALQYSDSRGVYYLVSGWVWFSGGNGACMANYEGGTNRLYLLNDAGDGWMTGTPGASAVLQNSSCLIDLSGITTSFSGNVMTVNLPITFKSAFAGTKQIQMFANAAGQLSSGWQIRGSWIVP